MPRSINSVASVLDVIYQVTKCEFCDKPYQYSMRVEYDTNEAEVKAYCIKTCAECTAFILAKENEAHQEAVYDEVQIREV